jgi:beta propeller repeat protein
MGTDRTISPRIHAGACIVLVLLILLAAAALALPPRAAAGYVASRFTAPSPPDPAWENAAAPQVSQGKVAYHVSGDDDFYSGYVWGVGGAAASAWTQFAHCWTFDYANWDPGDVVVYGKNIEEGPDEVWVTDGTVNFKLNLSLGNARYPRISGVNVVWQEQVSGDWDIMAAQLDSDTLAVARRFTVCGAAGDQTRPDVDGDHVVWQDHRSGQWDIWSRKLGAGGTKLVCGNPATQANPTVAEHWVAWEDRRNVAAGYSTDIYARKAWWYATPNQWKLGAVRAISHAKGRQLQPAAGRDYIVWEDWRNAADHAEFYPPNVDIRGYRIPARRQFRVSPDTTYMYVDPDIEYGTVVYAEFDSTHMTQPWGGLVKGAILQP